MTRYVKFELRDELLLDVRAQDFVSLLMTPIGYVQGQNWDPKEGSDDWRRFCAVLGSGGAESMLGVVRVPAVVSNLARWVREASQGIEF